MDDSEKRIAQAVAAEVTKRLRQAGLQLWVGCCTTGFLKHWLFLEGSHTNLVLPYTSEIDPADGVAAKKRPCRLHFFYCFLFLQDAGSPCKL